jgi:hypothetical protein
MPKIGGNILTLPELMSQNSGNAYRIRNKIGGFNGKDIIGLDYSSIRHQANNNGEFIDRSVSSQNIPNNLLATEQISTFPLIQKFVAYGTPSDTKLPFSYHGGNGKKPKTKTKNQKLKIKNKIKQK